MAENLNNLVSRVLQSPQLRSCIENCLNNGASSSGSSNYSIIRNLQSSSTLPPVAPEPPSVRNELQRLFPTIRSSNSSHIPSSKKRRVSREKVNFLKEVILLKNPSDSRTISGYKKAKSYEEGYCLSAVEFDKTWGYKDIHSKISLTFQNILNGADFEFVIPMGKYLVRPNLKDTVELDGSTLNKIYYNKSVYIRPLQLIGGTNEEHMCAENDSVTLENPRTSRSDMTDIRNYISVSDSSNIELTEISNEIAIGPEFDEITVEHTSLNEILSILSKRINEENTTFFNIYREDIWNCCIRPLKRKSFSPHNQINVIFTDCDNQSEGAIDAGGPKREMFRLILSYLNNNSRLFVGDNNKKMITLNKDALEKRYYYEAGRLIALAIVHVGFGPRFFSELFFTLLSQGSENIDPTVKDVQDDEVRNEIEMAIASEDHQSLTNIIMEGSFIKLAGWDIMNDFDKKDMMVKDVIKFYVVERCKKSLDQFVEGLEILDIYKYVKQYPEYMIELFCNTAEGILNVTKMEKIFHVEYSELGSNKRNIESRIIAYWKDYLLDCSENEPENEDICSLEEILIFVTGVNIIPSLGFSPEPTLKFLDDTCPYPKGNTCALEIHLPTIHKNYEDFKYHMSFGIKNGMVFGYT